MVEFDGGAVVPDMPPVTPAPVVVPGFIEGEPDTVEPEPWAVGRSPCARAGAAARAVTMRQAAMCFLSMSIS
jgi:hypothetical protein